MTEQLEEPSESHISEGDELSHSCFASFAWRCHRNAENDEELTGQARTNAMLPPNYRKAHLTEKQPSGTLRAVAPEKLDVFFCDCSQPLLKSCSAYGHGAFGMNEGRRCDM